MGQEFKTGGKAAGRGANGFDLTGSQLIVQHGATLGSARLAQMDAAVQARLDRAVPPPEMGAAPVAPARGSMRLVADYTVTQGGIRQRTGAHWQEPGPLSVMVEQARQRHVAKDRDEEAFVAPFTPGQIAVSEDYRALVERHEAGLVKGSSLDGGAGGGGSGLAIDAYIQDGRWLSELRRRIGDGVTMQVRRHMDRDNARRAIRVQVLVDMVLVQGKTLSDVLRAYGWAKKTTHLAILRGELSAALDRMQGYRDAAQRGIDG